MKAWLLLFLVSSALAQSSSGDAGKESGVPEARQAMGEAARMAQHDPYICAKYGQSLAAKLETRNEGLAWLLRARQLDRNLEHIDWAIGKTQFDLTDYTSASATLESELQRYPENGEAAFFAAESFAKLADWRHALKFYGYAIEHGSNTAEAYYGLGKSLVETNQCAEALARLERARELKPSFAQIYFQLARVHRCLEHPEMAERELTLFREISTRVDTRNALSVESQRTIWPVVKPLLERGKQAEALSYLQHLSPEERSRESPEYLLATSLFALGRSPDAKHTLQQTVVEHPNDTHSVALLGVIELAAGEPALGETALESALKADPANPLALAALGALRNQQQRWAESVDLLERSRTSDPAMLYALCEGYYRLGNKDRARLTAELVRAFASNRPDLSHALESLERAWK